MPYQYILHSEPTSGFHFPSVLPVQLEWWLEIVVDTVISHNIPNDSAGEAEVFAPALSASDWTRSLGRSSTLSIAHHYWTNHGWEQRENHLCWVSDEMATSFRAPRMRSGWYGELAPTCRWDHQFHKHFQEWQQKAESSWDLCSTQELWALIERYSSKCRTSDANGLADGLVVLNSRTIVAGGGDYDMGTTQEKALENFHANGTLADTSEQSDLVMVPEVEILWRILR